ncbi:hypothetical protein BX070DRAFT_58857 [Coemansia spiralis]|nr:hypothetical protein BX070DRAFT_58857 [Coemansia spiralis]
METRWIRELEVPADTAVTTPAEYTHQLSRCMLDAMTELRANQFVTVVAVVVGLDEPKMSNGTDFVLRLRITDPTLSAPLPLTIFRKTKDLLPRIQSTGDIIYFESAKTMIFASKYQLVSHYSSRWDVLPAGESVDGLHPLFGYLRRWSASRNESRVNRRLEAGTDRYVREMRDVAAGMYVDMFIEVLSVSQSIEGCAQYTITDYTHNPGLPSTQVQLTIYNPQSINKMPEMRPHMFYKLRNAKVVDANGLSLVLSVKPEYPKTILVAEVPEDDPRIRALLERKTQADVLQEDEEDGDNRSEEEAEEDDGMGSVVSSGPIERILRAQPTPIAQVLSGALNHTYHIRGTLTLFPPRLQDAVVCVCPNGHVGPKCACGRLEVRFLVRVADATGECVAACQGLGIDPKDESELLSDAQKLEELAGALAGVGSRAVDLPLAVVVVPTRGSVARCLLVCGGLLRLIVETG